MKRISLFSLSFLVLLILKSQGQANFSEHIAPILYKNCTPCHRAGGIGPFALESFQQAQNNGLAIKSAVSSGYMPPWPPDTLYSRFSHERTLTSNQIAQIVNWVDGGMPQGNPALAPNPPVFSTNSELSQAPSATYKMPLYTITSNQDDYRAFVIPSQNTVNKAISEVEFYPGNKKIVHHILLYYDTSGICQQLDDADSLPGYSAFGGIGNNNAKQIAGWVPGSPALKLPSNFGMPAYANGKFVMQVHYAPGSAGKKDSTGFGLIYKDIVPGMREVFQLPILNHVTNLINGPLLVPANQTKTFIESFTLPIPVSILGLTPHMHLIGRNMTSYAVLPNGDTSHLVRIKDWNFNWQGQYMFPKLQVFNAGTRFRAISDYDNTLANPFNPSNPPQTVTAGESTTDEMMMIYFSFVARRPGDENLILDSSFYFNPTSVQPTRQTHSWTLYPNPGKEEIFLIQSQMLDGMKGLEVDLMDIKGRKMKTEHFGTNQKSFAGSYRLDIGKLAPGPYFLIIKSENKSQRIAFVKE